MKHALTLLAASCLLSLTGCDYFQHPPASAYSNRSDPERLLVTSSEIVTVDLADKNYSKKLTDTLKHNPPSRAMLHCHPEDKACRNAAQILSNYKVAAENSGEGNEVALLYETIGARDCEQRYIDNSHNPSNLNYSSFGCSVTANTVQMVTDKQQFTNPSLMDFQDGAKAASVYDSYLNPSAASAAGSSSSGSSASSSLIPASSSGGGQ